MLTVSRRAIFSDKHPRRGFVLVAALLAIVLIGGLAAGVLFAVTADTRAASTGVAREVARIAAESAIAVTIGGPPRALPVSTGVDGTVSRTVEDAGAPVVVYITRLDSAIYWIVADVTPDRMHFGSRRRVGALVKAVYAADGSMSMSPVSQRWWSELF
jgi:type II secretory pathway pseudopilin PulG